METQLFCGHCSVLFQTPPELAAHNTIRHRCTLCNADFRDLTRHLGGIPLRAPFQCVACLVGFESFGALQTHIRTSPVDHHRTCMPCSIEFLETADIRCHRRHSHPVPNTTNRVVSGPVIPRVQDPTSPPEDPDAAEDLALLNELNRLAQITATAALDIVNLGERFEVLSAKRRSSTVPAINPPPPSCPICVEPCKEHTATVCGHLFCSSCINQWIDRGGSNVRCPTCNTRVNLPDLRRVYM